MLPLPRWLFTSDVTCRRCWRIACRKLAGARTCRTVFGRLTKSLSQTQPKLCSRLNRARAIVRVKARVLIFKLRLR